jgi:DNA-directed RNA polymerase sigma subunit (sigma70/sigma32)
MSQRYGLAGKEPRTLKEVAGEVGVKAERVRRDQLRAEQGLLRAAVAEENSARCGSAHEQWPETARAS